MRSALITGLLLASLTLSAQPAGNVIVDKEGVMRWEKSREEVKGFGINYTAMFAHAYRTAQRRQVPIEKAIEEDIYHFSRLGFDLFRVHVWDTEISDSAGNLINNEHLRLLDFAIARMKERGFRFVLTPIAFWGNGWPEPDEKTPGFSAKYGKDACLTDPGAIRAQQNYLKQFLNHKNAYTGFTYKEDPAVLAFEVSNEPHHRESPEKVTTFIKSMVDAMRSTGCRKPVFYNVSHSIHLADAYAKAGIQGGTFQWYPTGLGAGHELGGNLLPNVDRYAIPFASTPSWKKLAKIVYEFDAADVGRSYIYPAMARSFREAGLQVGTHFAYDPTFMADINTEYGTHYMNLVYAPQKALSLKIAGEVFRRVPMYKSYGSYPGNERFDAFRVSYEKDLAEMVTATEFYYTNSTETQPATPNALEHIAGSGDSPVVKYEGTGAYFLDKIEEGVWRLEVLPDAVWIEDPFRPASPKKEVAVIKWNTWPMKLALTDLGNEFSIEGLNKGNTSSHSVTTGSFDITPGTFLISRKGVIPKFKTAKPNELRISGLGTVGLSEFAATPTTVKKTHVVHQPLPSITEGKAYEVRATVIGKSMPEAVEVHVWHPGWRGTQVVPMTRTRNYQYTATMPEAQGFYRYFIVVREGGKTRTFPPDEEGNPRDWDFSQRTPYEVPIIPAGEPIYIFDANHDINQVSRNWLPGSRLEPHADGAELLIPVKQLFTKDEENPNGPLIADYSMRYYFGRKISGRKEELAGRTRLVLHGRAVGKPTPIQVALITRQGRAYGATITLEPSRSEYILSLADLKPVKLVTLPRPYPTFLPYYFEGSTLPSFNLADAETLQLSIGPGLGEAESKNPQTLVIRSVRLE
ncbi:MAG: membrane or secreted protein [Cyclobacteriaceae bacterium]|nr:membrane or secreted protein [Cyclobacteriaceae bacterium]